jgi:hypothetical protein
MIIHKIYNSTDPSLKFLCRPRKFSAEAQP